MVFYLRSSSFNDHRMCPQLYYLNYVLGHSGPSGRAATKGTIVHKALEITALCKKAYQENKETIVDEIVGEIETHNYQSEYLDNIIDQVYDHYTLHAPHIDWKNADRTHCHKWTWKTLAYNDRMFDPRNREIIDVEPHFDFAIEEEWAKYDYNINGKRLKGYLHLKGTIDLITKLDDECYEVVDWKTGRRLDWATEEKKTYEKLENDSQLRIYHYALTKLYPNIPSFLVTIGFINDGGFFSLCFTNDDIEDTKLIIKNRFEKIKATTKPELYKSWKCTRFCHMGMSTFENTDIEPIKETRDYQRTPKGQVMTKCETVKYMIETKGMAWVDQNYTKKGFDCSSYKSPGEVG